MSNHTDTLVIGSGAAGMFFALKAAEHGKVTVITKTQEVQESNSRYAQGGIAAVWSDDDSFDNHISDTLVAGAGLCRREAVELTVRTGPERVRELIEIGTAFTASHDNPDEYSLHREGGHSHRRILHADDLTGAEIVRALHARCAQHPNIQVLGEHTAIDLITAGWVARRSGEISPVEDRVLGAYVLNRQNDEVEAWAASIVVLATGGAGKVYQYTTNPPIATGDGIAMAWRAGAEVANMEFVQFHPTALYHHKLTSFLISEALRGDGGILRLPNGEAFMERYDERKDLAPRDIVARAIDNELKEKGLDCVYLDMRHLSADELERRYPNIDKALKSVEIDMSTDLIPVVPAAHYFCGGVRVDLNGATSVRNLYAIGETSCTGLHGANRLASNSLLEALVYAQAACDQIAANREVAEDRPELPVWDVGSAAHSDEQVIIQQTWGEIRRFMWNYVGIVRTHRRLKRAERRIALVQEEIQKYYWDFKITSDLIELRNLATTAQLVVRCALLRRESRGLHYTLDFPESDARFIRDTVIQNTRY